MKVDLNVLEKRARDGSFTWNVHDLTQAKYHLEVHLGWEMTKPSTIFWSWHPVNNVYSLLRLQYINPRTKGIYDIPNAIRWLVDNM